MIWEKIGKVFNPLEHALPNKCVSYAQAPQAFEFEDHFRVYFSAREKDTSTTYISHVCYAEITKDFRSVKTLSSEPVLKRGETGTYDEHGVFPLHVFHHNSRILGYISGWYRRQSVPADSAIGLAESFDGGQTFSRLGPGPIIGPNLHEPFLIADPFVLCANNTFHMWYVFGKKWITGNQTPERLYTIGHATSPDGVTWARDGRQTLSNVFEEEEECQAFPTVCYINGMYHMYFCFRHATDFRTNPDRSYRLGYAYSEDLMTWIRNDALGGLDVSENGWDSDMICYPNFFQSQDGLFLLYNGNQFGREGFGAARLISC